MKKSLLTKLSVIAALSLCGISSAIAVNYEFHVQSKGVVAPVVVATWTKCANENQICTVPGTKTVRYGANGTYFTKTATNSISCDNTTFGGDPIYGIAKTCEYQ